jgi:hypothetical protein
MATKVHLSRLAAWHSAVLLDQGRRNTLESSHAKRFAADSAMEVTTDAVQVYGGYGFIKDYPVEKLMRDAKRLARSRPRSKPIKRSSPSIRGKSNWRPASPPSSRGRKISRARSTS